MLSNRVATVHRCLLARPYSGIEGRGLLICSAGRRMAHGSAEGCAEPRNRLALEQSPYLLQHQSNPVDWYPWGEEAFTKAKREDKPIFLSVGYATCHWCHVMERESFEDQDTADLLNKHFVSIKVDREERPDVDRVYMAYVQAVSGRGGWPMSVFLTPDLEPLYGGTYYPKKDVVRGGELAMPAFTTVLRRLAGLWSSNREDLKAKGTAILSQLQEAVEREQREAGAAGSTEPDPDLAEHALETCTRQLAERFDARLGGFGGAPKFPRPAEINSLLCAHLWYSALGKATDAERALHMATFSLRKMAAGGMYDHIGGGFHRYSVDEWWHVPHFEKMLYDNPQLACTYLAAFQLTGDSGLARVVRGVLDYLRRDMTAPGGGLYSAEDADSYDPVAGRKTEGFFYIWTHQEVEAVLGHDRARLFCQAYSIRQDGNCTLSPASDPHNEFGGYNVPILLEPLQSLADREGMTPERLETELAECRRLLHAARAARPRPSLDDKVVCAWNGMGISAFARAARALASQQPPPPPRFPDDGLPAAEYLSCAQAVAAFVRGHLWDAGSRTLRRCFARSTSTVHGFADDYAQLVAGLLDLYEAGGGRVWLTWAAEVQARQDDLFWDAAGGGGYFSTTADDPSIKLRIKDSYDGAEPAATSIATSNLYRLAALLPAAPSYGTPCLSYQQRADAALGAMSATLFEMPLAVPQMCCAAFLKLCAPLRQVVLACSPGQADGLGGRDAQALLDAAHAPFVPDKAVVLINLADAQEVEAWRQDNPEALALASAHFTQHPDAPPTAFVCQNYVCQVPTAEPATLQRLLRVPHGAPLLQPAPGLPGL